MLMMVIGSRTDGAGCVELAQLWGQFNSSANQVSNEHDQEDEDVDVGHGGEKEREEELLMETWTQG